MHSHRYLCRGPVSMGNNNNNKKIFINKKKSSCSYPRSHKPRSRAHPNVYDAFVGSADTQVFSCGALGRDFTLAAGNPLFDAVISPPFSSHSLALISRYKAWLGRPAWPCSPHDGTAAGSVGLAGTQAEDQRAAVGSLGTSLAAVPSKSQLCREPGPQHGLHAAPAS